MSVPKYSLALVNVFGEFVCFAQGNSLKELDASTKVGEKLGLVAFGEVILGGDAVNGGQTGRRKVLLREEQEKKLLKKEMGG